jgi:hypothetical protein
MARAFTIGLVLTKFDSRHFSYGYDHYHTYGYTYADDVRPAGRKSLLPNFLRRDATSNQSETV